MSVCLLLTNLNPPDFWDKVIKSYDLTKCYVVAIVDAK
jgi:hypothetical protein